MNKNQDREQRKEKERFLLLRKMHKAEVVLDASKV